MRVAIICERHFALVSGPPNSALHGATGGGERYPTSLAAALNRYVATDLITCNYRSLLGRVTLRIGKGADLTEAVISTQASLLTAARMLTKTYDVLHFVNGNELTALTAILARLTGRGRVYLTPVGGGRRAGFGRLRISECLHGFLPITRYSAQNYPWLGTTKRPVTVIYGGGDHLECGEISRVDNGGRKYSDDVQQAVLFVGRIVPVKGVDILLRAIPTDMHGVIAGPAMDEDYFCYLKEIVDQRNLSVRFITDVDDCQLQTLYRHALVTVLPSVTTDYLGIYRPHPELLGLTVLESMWEGTPVIATAAGAMEEIIDPSYGDVFPSGDVNALRLCLEGFRDAASDQGRGLAAAEAARRRFSWDLVAQRALASYESNDHDALSCGSAS